MRGAGVAVLLLALLASSTAQKTFLGTELPLKVTVTTPYELSDGNTGSLAVNGRQAITAVFSRPVIALGSDFGDSALPANLVPFTLSCGSLGRLRWVTTSIARWDPRIDWPTDLACKFAWNKGLTTFDGAPLVLPEQEEVTLTTPAMSMTLGGVQSAKAQELTDNQWDATAGLPADQAPEVPPDANVTLSFTYPIQLNRLATALRLEPASGQTLTVLPCQPPLAILPLAGAAAAEAVRKVPLNCALVQIRPGLAPGAKAKLVLPKGSVYNEVAGPSGSAQEVQVVGLRAFKIPLRTDFQNQTNPTTPPVYDGIRYRRVSMWLPHGLADNTTALQALSGQISICPIRSSLGLPIIQCRPMAFTLTRPTRGTLVMSVPGIQPLTQYRVTIAASDAVRDGYNLPLQASSNQFWSLNFEGGFTGPSTTTVAILEEGTGDLVWPFVGRGDSGTVRDAAAFPVDPARSSFRRAVQLNSYADQVPIREMGTPARRISRGLDAAPAFQNLTLGSTNSLTLVTTCCNTRTWPTTDTVFASGTMVVRSNLQLVALTAEQDWTAWVTSVTSGLPVARADVQIYTSQYGQGSAEAPADLTCTTDATGSCTIKGAAASATFNYRRWSALVSASGFGPLYVSDVSQVTQGMQTRGRGLQGKLVLDRKLVKPGQKLYVKAYVLRQSGSNLLLPSDVSGARWQVSPNFDAANNQPWSAPATLSSEFGTAEGVIDVPEGARLVDYSVTLLVKDNAMQGSDTAPASETFMVADPRPPTAEMSITGPNWVKPKDNVKIGVNITSYLGVSIGSADVELSWSTDKAKGNQTITTNAEGEAEATIPLGRLPQANVSLPGNTLTIQAVWIGNTRERITATKIIKIEEGPIKVNLERTLLTDIPGMAFGVVATATSNDNDKPLPGTSVTVTLVPVNASTLPAGCADAASKVTCTIRSSTSTAGDCQLALPCAAEFRVRGCVASGSGQSCSSQLLAGRNASSWQQSPWAAPVPPNVLADKAEYSEGSEVVLQVQNSYYGTVSALVMWGNALQRKTKLFRQLPAGANQLKIGPIGEECRSGCTAVVALSVARGTSRPATTGVTVSRLFDPLAPHTQTSRVDIKMKQTDGLNVTITGTQGSGRGGKLVVAPSASSTIRVRVTAPGGTPAAGAQVTLVGVDEALLDLVPYPLQDVNSALQPDTNTNIAAQVFNSLRVLRGAISAAFSTLQRRLRLDPFLPLDTQVQPSGYTPVPRFWGIAPEPWSTIAAVDQPDAAYLARYSSPITPLPSSGICRPGQICPVPMPLMARPMFGMVAARSSAAPGAEAMAMVADGVAPAPAPMAKSTNAAGGDAAGGPGVQGAPQDPTRSDEDFNTTPIWATRTTGEDGTVTFTFKAPVNLGSFVVRAYAVLPSSDKPAPGERQANYGGAESSLIVRRPISLEAAIPRIVRVGDTFEAGVLLTGSLGATAVSVVTTVNVTNTKAGSNPPIRVTGSNTSSLSLSGELQQREVRFAFRAVAIGTARLAFRVTTPAGGDALEVRLPVKGKQGEVFVATSFAIQANGSKLEGREEGLALPRATPGSGDVRLVAGVGNLPAIQTTYVQLINQADDAEWPEATLSLAVGLHPIYLAAYFPGKPTSAYAPDKQLGLSTKGLTDVAKRLTTDSWGLVYVDPARGPWWKPTSTDIPLNAWATYLVERAGEEVPTSNAAFASAWSGVTAVVPKWRAALQRQLEENVIKSRSGQPPRAYDDFETIAWARLVLGPDWMPISANADVAADLAMSRLTTAAVNLTAGGQARVALTLLQDGAPAGSAHQVNATVKRLLSRVRVGGRTAYVAAEPNGRSAAPMGDQAFVLALFQATNTKNELVQKLSAYIAAGNPPSPRWPMLVASVGGWTAALSSASLQSYDAYTGSTKPNLQFAVVAANATRTSTLLEASFTPDNAGTTIAAKPIGWGSLPANATLQFTGKGKGQASVAASLTFTPAELLPFPSYRGMWVQRVLQRADNPQGSLGAVPLKTLTTTVVQVTTPDDMQQVVVEVWMPGGLEPLDPRIYKDADAATICRSGQDEEDITAPSKPGGGFGIMPRGDVMVMPAMAARPAGRRLAGAMMLADDMAIRPGGFGGFWRIWPPWPVCPAQETAPDVVTFTFSFMAAGTHTIRFQSVAATPGTFVLPPVKVYVTQQPEVMGLSAAGSFKVCPTADDCDGKLPAIAAPKPCPADCNDNGSCDLSTGKCLCNAGFSGKDCGTFSSV